MGKDSKTWLLVGNPTSRGGKAQKRISSARMLLDKYDIDHDFRSTLPNALTSKMVSDAITCDGFKKIIYLGGDGTFQEVAKGICASGEAGNVFLGMLPSGTANDQGKSFGLSSHKKYLENNVQIIAEQNLTNMEVGEITALDNKGTVMRRDLFFDSIGWGLSASILSFRNRELGRVKKLPVVRDIYRDQMLYIRAAVHEFALNWLTNDRFSAQITIDGNKMFIKNLTDLIINNTIIYAGDWISNKNCLHDDGLFDVTAFHSVADWTSQVITNYRKPIVSEETLWKVGVPKSSSWQGKSIEISITTKKKNKRVPAQFDGEEFPPADRYKVKVHNKLINLIVPKDFN